MQRTMLKSKIHRVKVTGACVDYEGSVTIDSKLLEASDILEYEQVHIYNVSNGERFATYVIEGEPNSGVICLNGPAARHGFVGDRLIILSYGILEVAEAKRLQPKIVYLDPRNKIKKS